MGIRAICTVLASLAVLAVVSEAQAQLFGERSIGGSSVTRRSRPGDTQAGTVTGSERFLRDNREDGNFIGADSRDTRAFVGAQQATTGAAAGRSGLATPPVRIETAPDANRIQQTSTRPTTGMYSPRLRVGFDHPSPSSRQISTSLAHQLEASLTRRLQSVLSDQPIRSLEVSLEGEMATLRGEVFSERERYLAALLTLFEPGISEVQNDLIVKPPSFGPRSSRPGDRVPRTDTQSQLQTDLRR